MKQNLKNKGIQDAFEKVLKRYKNNSASRYICFNLQDLRDYGKITYNQWHDCKEVVRSQLRGTTSLESWLVQKGYANDTQVWGGEVSYKKMNKTRINWLKHLIEQCKKNKF